MEVREQAYKDYKKGMKYKEIAEKYGVTLSAVKSWAARYWKKDKRPQPKIKKVTTHAERSCDRTVEAETSQKRSGGAPNGNQNALGNVGGDGAPRGNLNALKHGGYSPVYWDTLTEEERRLIEGMPIDTELLMIEEIQLLTVRERRMMNAINQLMGSKDGLYIESIYRTKDEKDFATKEDAQRYNELRLQKIDEDKISYLYDKSQINTETRSTIGAIERLESELTKVQSRKSECIKALAQIQKDRSMSPIDAVSGEPVTNKEPVVIYVPDNGRDDA